MDTEQLEKKQLELVALGVDVPLEVVEIVLRVEKEDEQKEL